tara:strand:- start:15816 stop:16331 length:516 start_codon:yes stop_codon:yes gene_type:complete
MTQNEILFKKLKGSVLAIADYSTDPNAYMPETVKRDYLELKEMESLKKEFGYNALPSSGLSTITKLKERIDTFNENVNSLIDKINLFSNLDIDINNKITQMESLSEVLKIKGNTVREKSIFQANQEMNFALNKQKQTLNANLPKDKELIGKIENLLETKNNSPKNTKKASI